MCVEEKGAAATITNEDLIPYALDLIKKKEADLLPAALESIYASDGLPPADISSLVKPNLQIYYEIFLISKKRDN